MPHLLFKSNKTFRWRVWFHELYHTQENENRQHPAGHAPCSRKIPLKYNQSLRKKCGLLDLVNWVNEKAVSGETAFFNFLTLRTYNANVLSATFNYLGSCDVKR